MVNTNYNIIVTYDPNLNYYIASMPEVRLVATGSSQSGAVANLMVIAATAPEPVQKPYVYTDRSGVSVSNGVTYSATPMATFTFINPNFPAGGGTFSGTVPLNPNFI